MPVADSTASSSVPAAVEPVAGLLDLAHDDARPEPLLARRQRRPGRAARRAASSCRCRSARRCRPARPSRSRGRPARGGSRPARPPPRRGDATTSPLRSAAADARSAGPTPPTACRPRRAGRCACSVLARPWTAMLLAGLHAEAADVLVVVGGSALGPVAPRRRPLALPLRPAEERLALVAVLGVGLLGVPAGRRLLLLVRQPAAAEALAVRVCSSSSTTSVTVRSRKARSWLTTTTARRCSSDPRLQPLQPGEVEVVGRLVEEDDVLAGDEQRRRARPWPPRRPTAWSSAGRAAPAGRPRSARGLLDPGVEVGGAEVQPRVRARCRSGRPAPSAPWRPAPAVASVELRGRRRDARAAAQERPHRLARPPLRLLVEQADGRASAAAARPGRRPGAPDRPGP